MGAACVLSLPFTRYAFLSEGRKPNDGERKNGKLKTRAIDKSYQPQRRALPDGCRPNVHPERSYAVDLNDSWHPCAPEVGYLGGSKDEIAGSVPL